MRFSLVAVVFAALFATGCQNLAQSPPTPSPSPAASATPRAQRIAVVDMDRLIRRHPRAAEFEGLRRKIAEIEVALRIPLAPPTLLPPQIPRTARPGIQEEIRATLQTQADQLRKTYQEELTLLEKQGQEELKRYAEQLQAEQRDRLQKREAALRAEFETQSKQRQRDAQVAIREVDERTVAEYRTPLLNVRLRLEAAQLASREQADKLVQDYERLQRERDQKIDGFRVQKEQEMQAFAKEREEVSRRELEALHKKLNEEGQRLVAEREAMIRARIKELSDKRQVEFQRTMREREQALVGAALGGLSLTAADVKARIDNYREIVKRAEERYLDEKRAQQESLQTQLRDTQRQTSRLQAVMAAELRVDVAAIALEKQLDVVLVRYLTNFSGIDITEDVIARLNRR